LDNVLALCDEKTKLIFIANPNNPTGTLFQHEPLVKFLKAVPSSAFVVLDEAYSEYVNDPDYPRSLELRDTFSNLIILRTFSKVYGLAGLRIGYAIAQPDVRVEMEKRKTPFSINRMAAAAALGALDDNDYIQKCIAVNETERTWLFNQLQELGYNVTPSQANFLMIEFPDEKQKDETYYQLRKEGILIRPLEPFGVKLGLRISVGRPEDNHALIDCLSKLKL
jgi:histidinol-phosphate aminotransferase